MEGNHYGSGTTVAPSAIGTIGFPCVSPKLLITITTSRAGSHSHYCCFYDAILVGAKLIVQFTQFTGMF